MLLTGRFFGNVPLRRSLIYCFALSFYPLVLDMNLGQISTIAFFAFAVALREQDRGHSVLSGLALSVCLYKPTLLMLFLPMLLIRRQYRTLLGFAGGALGMGVFVTAVQGLDVWPGYIRMLLSYGSVALQSRGYQKLPFYVDISSFSALLPGGRSLPACVAFSVGACCAAFFLYRAWRDSVADGKTSESLIWAATLTWTLILNIYVGINDCILVILSLIATAGALKSLPQPRLGKLLVPLWVVILGSSWIMLPLAEATGFQIMTVLFALLGILQLMAVRSSTHAPQPQVML
jgi:hypothetical protein